jgi:RNA-directed DNA polymerase
MLKSWYAKLLALRRVTQDNQGKKTAGVDGVKFLTPKQRLELAHKLSLKDKVLPTRRVWIPKSDGTQRGLGIPIMKDRATQALAKLALEPEWEAIFEPNSYGFRPGRAGHDAIEAIYSAINKKAKYILDADIAKCFDQINHECLLNKVNTFPAMRRYLKKCLKAGVMDGKKLFPTEEGTPQGGVISPLLANIALHGMETHLKEWLWQSGYRKRSKNGQVASKKHALHEFTVVRYADDLIIAHPSLEVIQKAKEQIKLWLREMGLEIKESKTKITHTLEEYEGNVGFDFLGFTIRQFKQGKYRSARINSFPETLGFKTLIRPSKEKALKHHQELRDVIRKSKSLSQKALIAKLNPIITGWCNYYKTVCAKEQFSKQEHLLWGTIWAWAKRRHPKKSAKWIINKYWKVERKREKEGGKYIHRKRFTDGEGAELKKHEDVKIIRHTKVKGEASPYDGNWVYWSTRMGKHPETPKSVATLLKKQKGKCLYCGLHFRNEDIREIDHIIPRSKGGKEKYENLQLLLRHCHDVKTTRDGSYGTHDKSQLIEERNEVKVSRSVLKTSSSREGIA